MEGAVGRMVGLVWDYVAFGVDVHVGIFGNCQAKGRLSANYCAELLPRGRAIPCYQAHSAICRKNNLVTIIQQLYSRPQRLKIRFVDVDIQELHA